jgi:hypothetical protein
MIGRIVDKFERNTDDSQISVALSEITSIMAISDCQKTILQTVICIGTIISVGFRSNEAAEDVNVVSKIRITITITVKVKVKVFE